MKTIVRCSDRMVFEINPSNLEPIRSSYYDAYCYVDPLPDVKYIEYPEWLKMTFEKLDAEMDNYWRRK